MTAAISITIIFILLAIYDKLVNQTTDKVFIPLVIGIAFVWAFYGMFMLGYWAVVWYYTGAW